MTAVELRPFYCPIEPAIHPDADLVERRAVEWLDRVRFHRSDRERARSLATRSAEFYARFVPGARLDGLQACVQWVYWGFAFDDAYCDQGELSAAPDRFMAVAGPVQRAMEAPWHPVPGEDPFAAALRDIGRRFHACATPVQVRRFADAQRAWLFGVVWQVANRARQRMPGLAEYTAIRLTSAGGPPTIAMLEIAAGAEVPAAEMDSPAVRALTEMAILIASWDNDLHSYRKELSEQETDQNLVNVLRMHAGLATGPAVEQAYGLRDRVMTRFLRLRERVDGPHRSSALRLYLDNLGHAVRGNIDWAMNVPRYTSDGELVPGGHGCTDVPPRLREDGPLPIPAIAWWWDDLG